MVTTSELMMKIALSLVFLASITAVKSDIPCGILTKIRYGSAGMTGNAIFTSEMSQREVKYKCALSCFYYNGCVGFRIDTYKENDVYKYKCFTFNWIHRISWINSDVNSNNSLFSHAYIKCDFPRLHTKTKSQARCGLSIRAEYVSETGYSTQFTGQEHECDTRCNDDVECHGYTFLRIDPETTYCSLLSNSSVIVVRNPNGYETVQLKCDGFCDDGTTVNPCENNGTCYVLGSEPYCICQRRTYGRLCEHEFVEPPSDSTSVNGQNWSQFYKDTVWVIFDNLINTLTIMDKFTVRLGSVLGGFSRAVLGAAGSGSNTWDLVKRLVQSEISKSLTEYHESNIASNIRGYINIIEAKATAPEIERYDALLSMADRMLEDMEDLDLNEFSSLTYSSEMVAAMPFFMMLYIITMKELVNIREAGKEQRLLELSQFMERMKEIMEDDFTWAVHERLGPRVLVGIGKTWKDELEIKDRANGDEIIQQDMHHFNDSRDALISVERQINEVLNKVLINPFNRLRDSVEDGFGIELSPKLGNMYVSRFDVFPEGCESPCGRYNTDKDWCQTGVACARTPVGCAFYQTSKDCIP